MGVGVDLTVVGVVILAVVVVGVVDRVDAVTAGTLASAFWGVTEKIHIQLTLVTLRLMLSILHTIFSGQHINPFHAE